MFEESEHPRKSDGTFKKKYGADDAFTGKEFRQNTSYAEILARTERNYDTDASTRRTKNDLGLTKRDFARFYKKLGEIQSGGFVYKNRKGDKLIVLHKMDDEDIPKIIVTGGTYANPRIKMVLKFSSEELMFERLETLL